MDRVFIEEYEVTCWGRISPTTVAATNWDSTDPTFVAATWATVLGSWIDYGSTVGDKVLAHGTSFGKAYQHLPGEYLKDAAIPTWSIKTHIKQLGPPLSLATIDRSILGIFNTGSSPVTFKVFKADNTSTSSVKTMPTDSSGNPVYDINTSQHLTKNFRATSERLGLGYSGVAPVIIHSLGFDYFDENIERRDS